MLRQLPETHAMSVCCCHCGMSYAQVWQQAHTDTQTQTHRHPHPHPHPRSRSSQCPGEVAYPRPWHTQCTASPAHGRECDPRATCGPPRLRREPWLQLGMGTRPVLRHPAPATGGKSQVRGDSLAQHKQSAIPASVRTRTPHLPATRPLHDGSVPIPSGVTIPIPVTTTRRTGTVSGGAGSDAIVRVRMSVATVALATRRPSAFVPCRATRPMYRILLALSAIFSDLDSFVRSWPACLEACANRHRAHAADSCITHTRSLRYQSCVATDPHRLFLFRPKLKF